jgi:hypothetical protein
MILDTKSGAEGRQVFENRRLTGALTRIDAPLTLQKQNSGIRWPG